MRKRIVLKILVIEFFFYRDDTVLKGKLGHRRVDWTLQVEVITKDVMVGSISDFMSLDLFSFIRRLVFTHPHQEEKCQELKVTGEKWISTSK